MPPSLDDYAADIGHLLDCLEIDNAVIAGLSMGGYIAFALFRMDPDRVTAMLLADTRAQADTPEGRQGRARMRELLAREGPPAIAREMLPKLLTERTRRERPDLAAEVRGMIESNRAAALDAAIAAMMARPDSTPDLARIAVGTLVVVGEEDSVTPVTEAESMHRAIVRSTLTVLPGAGHLSNLEQPELFSKALADFLLAHL
jgi:pimeloyl-ACP methyl ester carboxylesterase